MENEYQILTHLQENEETSQRKIAQRTGLSLGAVNILIKKMVRKGLIKIEKLNSRTFRYILTPQGIKEKTRLTYQFVRHSYNQIISITNAVEKLINTENAGPVSKEIVLYGPADEIREILIQYLKERALAYAVFTDFDLLRQNRLLADQLILTWRAEEEDALDGHCHAINILKLL